MHLDTILDLITAQETTATQTAQRLREQISALTTELDRTDRELADLATTRTTLKTIAAAQFTAEEPIVISSAYQQILTILGTAPDGIRAKGICLALDIEPTPAHVEGTRAKLKRLVHHKLVTETEPGLFTLTPKRT
ncbi:phosphomevalonate kinase [Catenuloplanes nepalensis]|uniref:Phosphomevalonate kinase n=1 Tax=Catenuloplanes nepalensis TaxID=587533 RepID=A0ABT9MLI6_9ACTN|nr:hypothetical protein [Catenuloplanes nepalensis]MDP9792275.1 phosphomevalonate kinase [Catenuloplanes nepalensis]MDP9792486.1 phosphomevalonate kinase [Catenuloplanes nepalensis]